MSDPTLAGSQLGEAAFARRTCRGKSLTYLFQFLGFCLVMIMCWILCAHIGNRQASMVQARVVTMDSPEDQDYYMILGVPRDADANFIRMAYRNAVFRWHPDKNPGDRRSAERKFAQIAEAYATLSDKSKRLEYDQCAKTNLRGQAGNTKMGNSGSIFSSFNPFKILKKFFDCQDPPTADKVARERSADTEIIVDQMSAVTDSIGQSPAVGFHGGVSGPAMSSADPSVNNRSRGVVGMSTSTHISILNGKRTIVIEKTVWNPDGSVETMRSECTDDGSCNVKEKNSLQKLALTNTPVRALPSVPLPIDVSLPKQLPNQWDATKTNALRAVEASPAQHFPKHPEVTPTKIPLAIEARPAARFPGRVEVAPTSAPLAFSNSGENVPLSTPMAKEATRIEHITNPSIVRTNDPRELETNFQQIGDEFMRFYYKTFEIDRKGLVSVYDDMSLLTFEGEQFQGVQHIVQKLASLPNQIVEHRMVRCDPQPVPGTTDMVLVFVTGDIIVNRKYNAPVKFAQIFQLMKKPAGSWLVLNDMFNVT